MAEQEKVGRPEGSRFTCVWEGYKPSAADLRRLLVEHKEWLNKFRDITKEVYTGPRPHSLQDASLLTAHLRGAQMSGIDLSGANLWSAKLSQAKLGGANLLGAILYGADLHGTNLARANLKKADIRMADLSDANVTGVKYNRKTRFLGARLATCYGSPKFLSFALNQQYLEEMRQTFWGNVLYWLWLIFADCGRTIWYWLAWSIAFCFGFAWVYYYLNQASTAFKLTTELGNEFGTMLYYSVVTLTTLGFGDITPLTQTAAYWVMAEVILGYVMLGGLISIFATKLARRF